MISWHPPQIFLWFGTLPITFYGVMMAGAIAIAAWWTIIRARQRHLSLPLVEDTIFWAVLGGILGARLGFVLQQSLDFFETPWTILAVWDGGLSFHGALVGGIVAALIFLKNKQQLHAFPRLADLGALPILLAAAIGRLGNWANQELYGYPTDLPWGVVIDLTHRLPGYEAFTSFHPTFAYEAILNLVWVAILLVMEAKSQKLKLLGRPGTISLLALGWYAIARGITEVWRISDRVLGPLSLAQLISLGLLLAVVWALTKRSTANDA